MSEPLSADQLQQLCTAAIQAARQAGRYIQSVDRDTMQRRFKEAGSSEASQLVTDVDVRSEAIIREHLRAVSQQCAIAFVGEESSQKVQESARKSLRMPYFWCVDPLDGTLPFVQGQAGYAVSIALVEQSGNPLIGVVYDPVESTLIHAIQGQGAHLDMSALCIPSAKCASTTRFLQVFSDASFKAHKKYEQTIEVLNACAQSIGLAGISFVYGNGAVKNACQVLKHSAACYLKLPKAEEGGGSIWDFAATACIAIEAGAWASDVRGQPLALNSTESTFMNRDGVLYASNPEIARYLIDAL